MRVVYINGNMTHHDHGLAKLLQFTQSIFTDLGVETETIDLGAIHPPHYEGETHPSIDNLIGTIKSADGIVIACTAQLFAPTAIMQSFLEYMQNPEYSQIFTDKHCFLIVLSKDGGEKSALDYLSRVTLHLGGFAHAQIGLQSVHLAAIESDTMVKEFVEKETEDFYRAVNQNRRYVMPLDYSVESGVPSAGNGAKTADSATVPPAPSQSSIQNRLDAFTEEQEQDIEELSKLFSQKYNDADNLPTPQPITRHHAPVPPLMAQELPLTKEVKAPPSAARTNSAQQITQSLPHYFQPQLSAGLQATIQINISGAENFEGFLHIHSTECTYSDGTAPAPDIIIMADASVWMDILKNKQTAQKAFMIGGLKVRGDFVLLTKFDSLFKMS